MFDGVSSYRGKPAGMSNEAYDLLVRGQDLDRPNSMVATPGLGGLGGAWRGVLGGGSRLGGAIGNFGNRVGSAAGRVAGRVPSLVSNPSAVAQLGVAGGLGGATLFGSGGGSNGTYTFSGPTTAETLARPNVFRQGVVEGQTRSASGGLVDPAEALGLTGSPAGGGQDAEAVLAAQLGNIEQSYQQQVSQLQSMFQLSETPEEQAMLGFVLSDLEAQRDAARTIIGSQFAQASRFADTQAGSMRDSAASEAAAVGDVYSGAASNASDAIAEIAGEAEGTGVGAGVVPVSTDATDWVGLIEGQGASQAGLTSALGNIAADDVAALGAQLQGEGSAQAGAMERAVLGIRAQQIADHQRQVQNRIAQERSAMISAALGLQRDANQRRYALEDRQFGMNDRLIEHQLGLDAGAEVDRRRFMLDQMADDRARQLDSGGDSGLVPSDPVDQIVWAGDLVQRGGPSGYATIQALVRQGALPPSLLSFFEPSL